MTDREIQVELELTTLDELAVVLFRISIGPAMVILKYKGTMGQTMPDLKAPLLRACKLAALGAAEELSKLFRARLRAEGKRSFHIKAAAVDLALTYGEWDVVLAQMTARVALMP